MENCVRGGVILGQTGNETEWSFKEMIPMANTNGIGPMQWRQRKRIQSIVPFLGGGPVPRVASGPIEAAQLANFVSPVLIAFGPSFFPWFFFFFVLFFLFWFCFFWGGNVLIVLLVLMIFEGLFANILICIWQGRKSCLEDWRVVIFHVMLVVSLSCDVIRGNSTF